MEALAVEKGLLLFFFSRVRQFLILCFHIGNTLRLYWDVMVLEFSFRIIFTTITVIAKGSKGGGRSEIIKESFHTGLSSLTGGGGWGAKQIV